MGHQTREVGVSRVADVQLGLCAPSHSECLPTGTDVPLGWPQPSTRQASLFLSLVNPYSLFGLMRMKKGGRARGAAQWYSPCLASTSPWASHLVDTNKMTVQDTTCQTLRHNPHCCSPLSHCGCSGDFAPVPCSLRGTGSPQDPGAAAERVAGEGTSRRNSGMAVVRCPHSHVGFHVVLL